MARTIKSSYPNTVELKLIEYLKMLTLHETEEYISSSTIETLVPHWAEKKFNVTHNGSTFGRAWRKLREKHNINIEGIMKLVSYEGNPINIHVKLDNKPNSREYRWKIQR